VDVFRNNGGFHFDQRLFSRSSLRSVFFRSVAALKLMEAAQIEVPVLVVRRNLRSKMRANPALTKKGPTALETLGASRPWLARILAVLDIFSGRGQ
jgi:hypothetical protein